MPPTDHDEHLPLDVGLDVDAATTLRVVSAAEARDVHHAALVDVHHAGCEGREGAAEAGPCWGHRRLPPWACWTPPVPLLPFQAAETCKAG